MKTLYIIRGIQGSGKSTLARNMLEDTSREIYHHFETDQYFVDKNGVYNFKPASIGAAHEWCYNSVESIVYQNQSVIVSNTFTRYWEMEDYLKLAKLKGFSVTMIECL